MACAVECRGKGRAGANGVRAMDERKAEVARECGRLAVRLVEQNVTPRSIITRPALENAIVSMAATGGSTNAVLHLMAIANEAEVDLQLDDFDRIAQKTPLLASLKPRGPSPPTHPPPPRRP